MSKGLRHHLKKHDSGWLWPLIGILAIVLIVWWIWGNQPVSPPANSATSTAQTSSTSSRTSKTVAGPKVSATGVLGVAAGLSDATIFNSWLQSTGVAAEISGDGPYTVFVPTDAAIAQLPSGSFRDLSVAEQKRFVEYHIVTGKVINVDAVLAGTVTTLSRDQLNFTRREGQTPLVGGGAIVATYKASNGVVYVVNSPLIPPHALQ